MCLFGAIKGEKRRRNKFNAKATVYNNDRFDSQFEANYAAELDLLIRSGQVKKYKRQVLYHFYAYDKHIADYTLDFLVTHWDDTIEAVECKGMWTGPALMKWKLFCAQMEATQPHVKLTVEREARKRSSRSMEHNSQLESIRKALEDGATLTPLDALHRGMFSLRRARTDDLRKEGYHIETLMEKNTSGRGNICAKRPLFTHEALLLPQPRPVSAHPEGAAISHIAEIIFLTSTRLGLRSAHPDLQASLRNCSRNC